MIAETIQGLRKDIENKFYAVTRPELEPWFPEDITTCSEDELGQLLNLYTLWKNYAAYELAVSESLQDALKGELRVLEAKELIKLSLDPDLTNLKAKEDRVAYVTQLPFITQKIQNLAITSAEVKLEKAIFENFEDRYNCASRELTRRGMNWSR